MSSKKRKYTSSTDYELIVLLCDSDHLAYTEIYNRYFYMVYLQVYKKLGDENQAKDIMQDIFANLWERRANLVNIGNLPGYLINAAKNRVFNFIAHQVVKSKYIDSLKNHINTGSIAYTDYLARENEWNKYIEAAIQSLPKKMRQVFELNKKDNFSYHEIATKLDTTENNVQKHINGAIKILKTKLTVFF